MMFDLLISQLKPLHTENAECIQSYANVCLKKLFIDPAINRGNVLLGVELHFPFNLPSGFRKCILTTRVDGTKI